MLDLKPYLSALDHAIIKPAPPWPKAAKEFMADNQCDLFGWYDGPDEDGHARIYLSFKHRTALDLAHTASEEVAHHLENSLNESAAKARAVGLLGYSRWTAKVSLRLLNLLLKTRKN